MDTLQKNRINTETQRKIFLLRLQFGLSNAFHRRLPGMIALGYVLASVLICLYYPQQIHISQSIDPFDCILSSIYARLLPFLCLLGLLGLLYCLGRPRQASFVQNALQRAGVVNHAGESPVLLSRRHDPKNIAITILELFAPGITFDQWENSRPSIESALNCYVMKITPGRKNNRVLLYYVPGSTEFPTMLPWKPNYLQTEDDSTLVLGQSRIGLVTVDLQTIPHILIGGSTGSGKSILLKLLLFQLLKKGAHIVIADFKGGVDFSLSWKRTCQFITRQEELNTALCAILEELEHRKQLLLQYNCANLQQLNGCIPDRIPRLVFACDEVAELFDKTGRSKADREQIDQITSQISTIARLGRAFGIHLILATQRPDAQILPGQIKNNMDCKLCGRADQVLSQIILDSPDAATLIPKDSHLFLRSDGTIFQPYLINEEDI